MVPRATILVVEDNILVRETTRTALEKAGYAVLEAGSGAEALARARLHHPDLILLDINMPDLTGFEVMQRLRMDLETSDAVILILTGTQVDEASQIRGLIDGADGYLTRPISNRVLVAVIHAHLRAKQNERLARMHAQQWHDLFETSLDGLAVVAHTGYLHEANSAARALLGIEPEQVRATRIDEQWLTGEVQEIMYPPTGRLLEVRSKPTVWQDEPAYLLVLRDMTGLRAAQEALRESEARFRRLAEHADDLIYRYDFLPAPHFSYVNSAATRITGYTPEEHYADPDLGVKLVHPDDMPLLASLLTGSIEAMHRPVVLRWRCKDGHVIWTEQRNVPVLDEAGRVIAIEGIARDITAQKLAELERERLLKELLTQKRHLESILEAIPDGVVVVNAEGQVMLSNSAAQALMPLLAGADWKTQPLTHLGEYLVMALRQSPPSLSGGWHEIRVHDRIFEVKARPVINDEIGHVVLVMHDVTEQRRQQFYQAQQERLATVGELAAGITHDFNNIMTVITLYVQNTLRLKQLSEEARDNLNIVLEETQHATRLIQQVLDFSRRSPMELRPLMLRPFIKELGKLLERVLPETITLRLNYSSEDDYMVLADPTRLQQAVLNLAFNARDAMEGRTPARLDLTLGRYNGEVRCYTCGQVKSAQAWVTLSVHDTGTGIPDTVFPHLFEPFFTTKPEGKGTGMGLPQVYGIVKAHQGHIEVRTQVGVGSMFTLYFPAYTESSTVAIEPEANIRRGQGEVILVVEDNEALRKALMVTLWEGNYWTLEASNGKEALALLEQHPEIVLILSDWVMPEMSGRALLEALRARGYTVPVIVMSGHLVEQELEALGDQLAGWVLKPVTPDQLYAMIEKTLADSPTRA